MNEIQRRRLEEIRAHEHRVEILRQAGLRPEDTEPIVKLILDKIQALKDEETKGAEETREDMSLMGAAQREQPSIEPLDIPKPEIQVDSGEPSRPQSAPSFSQRPSINSLEPEMPSTLIKSDGPKPLELPENKPADSQEPTKLAAAPPQIASTPAVADAAQGFDKAQENQVAAPPVSMAQIEQPKVQDPYSPPETKTPEPVQPLDAVKITPEQLSNVPPEAFKPASVDMAITQIAESPATAPVVNHPEQSSDTPVAMAQQQPTPEQLPPPPKGGIKQAAAARSEPVPSAAPQPPPPSPAQMFEESLARLGLPPEAMPPDMFQQWKQMNQAMLQTDDSRRQYGSTQVNPFPGGNPRSIHEGQGHLATTADLAASQLGDVMVSIAQSLIKLRRRLDTVERILEEGSV